MLDKIGEWYRIIDPDPEHNKLEARRKSLTQFLPSLKKNAKKLVPQTVAGLVWHFEPEWDFVQSLIDAIRENDLTFPIALNDIQLEVKVCAGLLLGEIMSNSRRGKVSLLTAAFVRSALGIPRESNAQSHHLARMLKDLYTLAIETIDKEAKAIRDFHGELKMFDVKEQFKNLEQQINQTPPGQPTQLWSTIAEPLQNILFSYQVEIRRLHRVAEMDREELELLWWTYSGVSKKYSQSFSELNHGIAILLAGSELSDIYLTPPLSNAVYLLGKAISYNQRDAAKKISLKSIVSDWSHELLADLCRDYNYSSEVLNPYPALLPMSWIILRLSESKMAGGWEEEFSTRSGISVDLELSMDRWGEQVMWELVAQNVQET